MSAMPDSKETFDSDTGMAVANYVAAVSSDLATMARRAGLNTLGYLLEMVRLEAESQSRKDTVQSA